MTVSVPGATPVGRRRTAEAFDVTTTVEEVSEADAEGGFAHLYAEESAAGPAHRTSGMGGGAFGAVLVIGVIGGLGLTLLTNGWIGGVFALMCLAWAIVLIPRRSPKPGPPMVAPSRAERAAVLGVLLAGALGGVSLSYLTTPWIGVTFGLVGLAWAIVLWPRPRVAPEPITAPAPVSAEEVAEVLVVETVTETLEEGQPEESATTVEARAPQFVPTRAVEVPVTVRTRAVVGDVPCPACGHMNVSGCHYCQACGAVMPDALIAPATVPHLELASEDDGGTDAGRHSPRLSRSWRSPILAGTLAFVFLSAIMLAVFGPFAFQFRLGTTQLFQVINQFIDPYAGNQPTLQSATATSTLTGTSPEQLLGDDASTFWASEPSFIFGAGNSVTVFFDRPYTINRAVILPGIQSGLFDVRAVGTPATVTLTFDDGSTVTQELEVIESQSNYRQLIRFPKTTTSRVTLKIDSVYPPRKAESLTGEVAISGLYFLEPPQPPGIIRVPTEIRGNPALPGTTN